MVKVILLFSTVAVVAARPPRNAAQRAEQAKVNTHKAVFHNGGNNAHKWGSGRANKQGEMGQCTGDCDMNSHCAEGLVCMKHNDAVKTSLCKGYTTKRFQYCGNPHAKEMIKDSATIVNHGKQVVTAIQKFSACRGHCHTDGDCKTGLKCHHRGAKGEVPGFTGCAAGKKDQTDADTFNFCYRPTLDRKDARHCADWTCTEWCQNFSAEDEAAGIYAANGCDADGDSCKCE